MDNEVVWEVGDKRLVLEYDRNPEAPYDDGSFPIISTDYRGAEQDTRLTSYVLDDGLVRAFARHPHAEEVFERYARIFHGCTAFEYREDRQGRYVALDPADWRETVGASPEHEDYSKNMLGEFGYYLDGECYVAVVQVKCDHGDWHDEDSVHGFFGEEWAKDGALDYFPKPDE